MKKLNDSISCKTCSMTYSFKPNNTSDDSSFICSSTNHQNKPQSVKLEECEKNRAKKLLIEWVCTDIRPFSVINDDDLRSVIQKCMLLDIFLSDVP